MLRSRGVTPLTGLLRQFFSDHRCSITRGITSWEAVTQPELLLVHPRRFPRYQLQEASRLAATLLGKNCEHVHELGPAQGSRPSPATFFGRGTVTELASTCNDVNPRRVFVNTQLTGVQQRNLEMALGRIVIDRVGLIIEIFSQRARTKEAKLQVQLAQLEYLGSRLVRVVDPNTGKRRGFGASGEVEVVSARERGRSGAGSGGLGGAGGGGESELELQSRRLSGRKSVLKRQLEEVRKTREVQRAGRRRSGKPLIALVGYTNAGKSSILGALSHDKASIVAEDKLFSTLDPTARRVYLPSGRQAIFSDTVGFISALPTQLIDAFRATLEEITSADLLLHVIDASSKRAEQQRDAVLGVLRSLGMTDEELDSKIIEVWNKSDLILGDTRNGNKDMVDIGRDSSIDSEVESGNTFDNSRGRGGKEHAVPAVLTSAATGAGLDQLLELIDARVNSSHGGEHHYGAKYEKQKAYS